MEIIMDTFIEATAQLLAAYPAATVLITYAKKNDNAHVVKFKVYHARLGKCMRYKTYKAKEVSRLMTFLGPHGVGGKRKFEHVTGAASVMANVKLQEAAETTETVETVEEDEPKKKKKKGKKK